jgi:hypothetical protein
MKGKNEEKRIVSLSKTMQGSFENRGKWSTTKLKQTGNKPKTNR